MQDEYRSLTVNSLYSIVYRLVNVLYPLISITYVSRILFADGIGRVAYAQNIVQYFVTVAALGIPYYGTREIARTRSDKENMGKVFSELFVINAISTTVCIIAYYAVIILVPYFSNNKLLFVVTGLNLVLNYINVDWFYQGQEDFSFIAKRNCIVKILSLFLIFGFVRDENDYVIFALIYSLTIAGNNILNIANLRGKVSFTIQGIFLKKHLKPILFLLTAVVSIEIYTLVDTTMLGLMCPSSVVGYYSNSIKFAKVVTSIITSMTAVILPRFSYYYKNNKTDELNSISNRFFKVIISLAAPATVGLILLSNDIIPVFFGGNFFPAIPTLRILSVLIAAIALNNFFGPNILITFGRENEFLFSVIIGAIINVFLNAFLIPHYLQNGAAVASVVSEICVTIVTFIFANRCVGFAASMRYFASLFLSVVSMAVVVELIKKLTLNSVIELIFCFSVGLLVYSVVGLFTRNEGVNYICQAVLSVIHTIRKKFVITKKP